MTNRFAIVGDMQETSRLEFWRESNLAARDVLIRQVVSASAPVVVLLGDMVFDGSSAAHWSRFDRTIAPLREAGCTLVPVIGNHEYWRLPFFGGAGRPYRLRYFEERFPGCAEPPCRVFRLGTIALVIIDSNLDEFSRDGWEAQLDCYKTNLGALDRDDGIDGVLVFSHHPPFTNSRLTSDELHVQTDFVPPFLAARKTLAMLSGHVHTYERFQKQGKTFVVTGGGGGPRVERHHGPRRRHEEAFTSGDGGGVRPLHYLFCEVCPDRVRVDVRAVGDHPGVLDQFELPYR